MAKLKVSSNIFQVNHKPILLLLFGICLSSIGYIKVSIIKFTYHYILILCLISLLFFYE